MDSGLGLCTRCHVREAVLGTSGPEEASAVARLCEQCWAVTRATWFLDAARQEGQDVPDDLTDDELLEVGSSLDAAMLDQLGPELLAEQEAEGDLGSLRALAFYLEQRARGAERPLSEVQAAFVRRYGERAT